jgi:hypothetical protein
VVPAQHQGLHLLLLLLLRCLARLPIQHRLVPVAGEEEAEGKALEQDLDVLLRSQAPAGARGQGACQRGAHLHAHLQAELPARRQQPAGPPPKARLRRCAAAPLRRCGARTGDDF